jgi:hypothetical protein
VNRRGESDGAQVGKGEVVKGEIDDGEIIEGQIIDGQITGRESEAVWQGTGCCPKTWRGRQAQGAVGEAAAPDRVALLANAEWLENLDHA